MISRRLRDSSQWYKFLFWINRELVLWAATWPRLLSVRELREKKGKQTAKYGQNRKKLRQLLWLTAGCVSRKLTSNNSLLTSPAANPNLTKLLWFSPMSQEVSQEKAASSQPKLVATERNINLFREELTSTRQMNCMNCIKWPFWQYFQSHMRCEAAVVMSMFSVWGQAVALHLFGVTTDENQGYCTSKVKLKWILSRYLHVAAFNF